MSSLAFNQIPNHIFDAVYCCLFCLFIRKWSKIRQNMIFDQFIHLLFLIILTQIKIMDELMKYLYSRYISSEDNLSEHLCKCSPISIFNLPKNFLTHLPPLLARNILTYDHTNLTLQILPSQILFFHRVAKIKKMLTQTIKDKWCGQVFNKWITSGFMGFQLQKNFEKCVTELMQKQILIDETIGSKVFYNFRVPQLTKLLIYWNLASSQKMPMIELQNHRQWDKYLKDKQEEKIQQYIIQVYGQNCLLLLTLIRQNSFINQKQLMSKSLLGVVELRKCLNVLIQNGIISFYQETQRMTIYESIKDEQLRQVYLNHICKSMLNLYIVQSKTTTKPHLIKIQSMILALDNILLLFQL